jgi:hypothetical protein
MLNFDLSRSDDFLVAGFRIFIESRRKERRLQVRELRGASNALSQARAELKHLAAARLIRAMPWEDAFTETFEACGRAFYATRPEVWRRAANKGESLLEIWNQKVINS